MPRLGHSTCCLSHHARDRHRHRTGKHFCSSERAAERSVAAVDTGIVVHNHRPVSLCSGPSSMPQWSGPANTSVPVREPLKGGVAPVQVTVQTGSRWRQPRGLREPITLHRTAASVLVADGTPDSLSGGRDGDSVSSTVYETTRLLASSSPHPGRSPLRLCRANCFENTLRRASPRVGTRCSYS